MEDIHLNDERFLRQELERINEYRLSLIHI